MKKYNFQTEKSPLYYDSKGDCGYIIPLNRCPEGEFVRLVSKSGKISKKVYIRDEYDRREKKYWLQDFNNISGGRYVKGDVKVFVGFEF